MRQLQVASLVNIRGRAWRCKRCVPPQEFIGERNKVVAHIFNKHENAREKQPFLCSLCDFACFRQRQMERHPQFYTPHQEKAEEYLEAGLEVDHAQHMLINDNAYQINETMDMEQMSAEFSEKHWQSRKRVSKTATTTLVSSSSVGEAEYILPQLLGDVTEDSLYRETVGLLSSPIPVQNVESLIQLQPFTGILVAPDVPGITSAAPYLTSTCSVTTSVVTPVCSPDVMRSSSSSVSTTRILPTSVEPNTSINLTGPVPLCVTSLPSTPSNVHNDLDLPLPPPPPSPMEADVPEDFPPPPSPVEADVPEEFPPSPSPLKVHALGKLPSPCDVTNTVESSSTVQPNSPPRYIPTFGPRRQEISSEIKPHTKMPVPVTSVSLPVLTSSDDVLPDTHLASAEEYDPSCPSLSSNTGTLHQRILLQLGNVITTLNETISNSLDIFHSGARDVERVSRQMAEAMDRQTEAFNKFSEKMDNIGTKLSRLENTVLHHLRSGNSNTYSSPTYSWRPKNEGYEPPHKKCRYEERTDERKVERTEKSKSKDKDEGRIEARSGRSSEEKSIAEDSGKRREKKDERKSDRENGRKRDERKYKR